MVDELDRGKPVYFDRSRPIGVEQVISFLGDVNEKGKLSEPDRSYLLAAGCFLEARDGGKTGNFENGKFLGILKTEFLTDTRFALAVAMDLVTYVATSSEWRFDDVFGNGAVGKTEVVALWNVLTEGCETALAQYLGETDVLKKQVLEAAIASFANNLEQGMEIEGDSVEERREIGPRVITVPKEAGKRLESWLAKPEVKTLSEVVVGDLVEKVV